MKRLIVCSDGTWGTTETDTPTNVVKIAGAIEPQAGSVSQLVFYDAGVGTGNLVNRLIAGATGAGLSRNVKDAYAFLVRNFDDGDEVFLFGFSRGAYTVRSTAGLINKCGLLRKEEVGRVEEAYRRYRDSGPARDFFDAFSREVRVKFLGVWDTVGSLGIPGGFGRLLLRRHYAFHNVELGTIVDHAYHALATDERRKMFKPTLWQQHSDAPQHQKVEQAWFVGAHSDVGGGLRGSQLSDIALLWMVHKAQDAGLVFRAPYLTLQPNPLGKIHDDSPLIALGMLSREIGAPETVGEALHGSALARYQALTTYRPDNLRQYLTKHWPPTIASN